MFFTSFNCDFLSTSQNIGWEEHLQYDLFSVEWDVNLSTAAVFSVFFISARCNIYISCLCYNVSVHLSVRLFVTEMHWHIIANLGFKF